MKNTNKEIDLYTEYLRYERSVGRRSAAEKGRILMLCMGVLCAVAAVLSCLYFVHRRDALSAQLNAITAEGNSPFITEGLSRYESVCAENSKLNDISNSTENLLVGLSGKPQYKEYDTQLFVHLSAVMTEKIMLTDIKAEDMRFELGFSAREPEDISEFVERLTEADIFPVVEYSGFKNEGITYPFTLICSLSESGGAEK